jgi:hypothetical protein
MVGAHPRTLCRKLFKKLQILTVPSQYIYTHIYIQTHTHTHTDEFFLKWK